MGIIFQNLTRNLNGELSATSDPVPANPNSSQGLLVNDDGEIYVNDVDPIDFHQYGLPFTASGALAVTGDVCFRIDQGIPFAVNGRIAGANSGATVLINQGIGYTADGAINGILATSGTVPGQVQNLITSIPVDNQINAVWDALVSVPAVTSYTIQYKVSTDIVYTDQFVGLVLTGDITGLVSGLLYDVKVFATNITGDGVPSVISQETVEGVPSQITDLVVTPAITQANMTWTAPSSAPAIASYDIEFKKNADATWIIFDGTGLDVDVDIFGLDAVLYDFRVRAVNSKGDATYSSTATATPTAIGSPKTVEWNEQGVSTASPITEVLNTGTLGSQYDLTVFQNQSNCIPNSHKGLDCWQSNGAASVEVSGTPADMGSQASFIWVGIPFFNDGNNRHIWDGGTALSISHSGNTVIAQSGSFLSLSPGMSTDSVEWIVYGRFESGVGTTIRTIKNDGATDNSLTGFAGNGLIRPQVMGWDLASGAGLDFSAQNYELTFYDGLLSTAEENALIDEMKQKWFVGIPAPVPPTPVVADYVWDETGLVSVGVGSPVTAWNNTGTTAGNNDYDTVVGTAANVVLQTQNSLNCAQISTLVTLECSNPGPALTQAFTVYLAGVQFAQPNPGLYWFDSASGLVNFNVSTFDHFSFAGTTLQDITNGSFNNVVFALVYDGLSSRMVGAGGVTFDLTGAAGANSFTPDILFWDTAKTVGQSFNGRLFEKRIYSSAHDTTLITDTITEIRAKWAI
tara:strand:+ start:3658 stop:5886 length:2229 start_codon:yes stop_codon:yes gene_type:complete